LIDPFDFPLHLHPGFSGKHQIQQDKVVMILFDLAEARFAIRGSVRRHAFGRKK